MEENGINEIVSEEEFFEIAVSRFKLIRMELPSQKELARITATARNNIFQKIYRQIENILSSEQKQKLDELLVVPESETFTIFDKLKSLSGKAGVENLSKEAAKLKRINFIEPVVEMIHTITFDFSPAEEVVSKQLDNSSDKNKLNRAMTLQRQSYDITTSDKYKDFLRDFSRNYYRSSLSLTRMEIKRKVEREKVKKSVLENSEKQKAKI